jgi:hypothetical protein
MDTIRKEEKLPLKSDPNKRDSSMAYLKDPPLTLLTTSPIAKIMKTVKSESTEPNLPQLDNDNGNNSSSSQSAEEPKKKRTATAIVCDMNKVTTMSTFPILQYDADTLKRQNGFQLYICALQNVLMNIHKLSNILIQFPIIQSVTDGDAQRALFSFVQSTVSPGYYVHLDLFVKEYGSHDGCAALRLLQNLCLLQDPTLQRMALRTYEHLSLGEDQKIISFNQHFNRAYLLVTACGIELEQKEQLQAYLNAVGGTHNAQLSSIIALYRHHFLSDNLHMSVYKLQTLLQQEEEQIAMQEQMNN